MRTLGDHRGTCRAAEKAEAEAAKISAAPQEVQALKLDYDLGPSFGKILIWKFFSSPNCAEACILKTCKQQTAD